MTNTTRREKRSARNCSEVLFGGLPANGNCTDGSGADKNVANNVARHRVACHTHRGAVLLSDGHCPALLAQYNFLYRDSGLAPTNAQDAHDNGDRSTGHR